jgi:CBS-domain-containing membrane protein
MVVADVMVKKVVTAFPSTPLKELWNTIFVKKINSVLIVDQKNKLIGIVCKDDLLSHLYLNYEEFTSDFESMADFNKIELRVKEIGRMTASEIMKRSVVYTRDNTHLMRALSRMIVRHVDQLPVVSSNNRLIGIISKRDVFNALFRKGL